MSKFMTDICRTVGCNDIAICDRCGNPSMGFFKKVLDNVFVGVYLEDHLDDLDQVELVMAIEEEYDIEILDTEAAGLNTPEQFYNYLFLTLGKPNV